MTGKTYATWVSTRMWCMQNEGKIAAIITREGIYEIKFRKADVLAPFPEEIKDDWVKRYFLEPPANDCNARLEGPTSHRTTEEMGTQHPGHRQADDPE